MPITGSVLLAVFACDALVCGLCTGAFSSNVTSDKLALKAQCHVHSYSIPSLILFAIIAFYHALEFSCSFICLFNVCSLPLLM
jgi:hypothetical protein